jgi:tRNA A-37 threonylcarbamoyl transferase component Bud32
MVERLADVRVSMLDARGERLLASITGLSARKVSSRLTGAHGNTRAGSLFENEWPQDVAGLGGVTAAAARDANLEDELVAATELSLRTVRSRLNNVHGKSLLANVFPELEDEEEEGEEEDQDDDKEGEEAGDADAVARRGGQQRFLDPGAEFSVTELVGAIPVAALRRARPLLRWLAPRAGLSTRVLSARARAVNGRTLFSTLLADAWPVRVAGPSRSMLAELAAATVARAPSLLRWVADVADLEPKDVVRRLDTADATTKMSRVVPELIDDGGDEADDGRDKTDDSGPPPSSRRKRTVGRRYELLRRLGEGGFGVAWEAKRLEHPRKLVVLKTSTDPARGRLREEMGIAFELRHQNICTYLDYGLDPGVGTYIVMDHGGTSLERIIENEHELALGVALEVVRQAAAGLDYAHSKGVIHQDVKPGNVLVDTKTNAWEVRLADFGIAVQGRTGKNTVGNTTVFATAPIAYTHAHAAPEQLRGEKAKRKTDQYALALVLCSMLEGRVFKRRYKPRDFNRLSPRQNAAVARALRDHPDERFETCAAFAVALGRG